MQKKLRKGYTSPVLLIGKINKKKKPIECTYTGTVKFYRSKAQSLGKLGKEDSEYNGEFGFDLYNKEHCPKKSFIYYFGIDGKLLENQSGEEFNGYVCPYMSIWPPKIDKSKSSVTLYVKADSDRNTDANVPEFLDYECYEWNINAKSFSTASSKLKISKIKTETNDFKIKIDCIEPFENDISIVAKCGINIVGRIIVKANAKVYETIIQPVLINFTNDSGKISTKVDEKKHDDFVINLVKYFNNKSFNQAYIKGNLAEYTQEITFLESDFTKDEVIKRKRGGLFVNYTENIPKNAEEYNFLVEKRYIAIYNNLLEIQINFEEMLSAIKKILEIFKDEFKNYGTISNLKKAKQFHKDQMATNAWNKAFKIYNDDYIKAKNKIIALSPKTINKSNITYVFMNKSIEGGKNEDSKTQAYSVKNSGITHIFNSAIKDESNNSLIIHEMGHALCLSHTFTDEANYEINGNNKLQSQLNIEKSKLLSLDKAKPEDIKYAAIDSKYLVIQKVINDYEKNKISIENFEKNFLLNIIGNYSYYDEDTYKFYKNTEPKISVIDLEKSPLPDINIENRRKEISDKIKLLEKKVKDLTPFLGIVREQSQTLENMMDYRQFESTGNSDENIQEEGKPNFNPKFQYKSFYQWQWKKILDRSVDYDYIRMLK
mgnify:CR=1 FL=1